MYKTFQALTTKYDDFSLPAVKILADGSELKSTDDMVLTGVRVDLDLKNSNVAEITFMDARDESDNDFKSIVEKKVMLGSILDISFGYASTLERVFYGYVARIDNMLEEGQRGVRIYAFDVRRLMMTTKRDKTYDDTMKSAIIQKIFAEYKKACPNLICRLMSTTDGNVVQKDTDYSFIMDYLLGSEDTKQVFYVAGNTAYIDSLEASMLNCVTTLEKGSGLYSFSDRGDYLDTEIEVNGYDPEKGEAFSATSSADSSRKQKKLVTGRRVFGSGSLADADEAKKVSKRISDELEKGAGGGTAVCVGMPELTPGSSVILVMKDLGISNQYLIKGAVHSYSEGSGYTVQLRFGDDELGDALSGVGNEDNAELPISGTEGIMLGKIVENWNESEPNKLKVELGIGEQGKTRTEWIPYVNPYAGKEFGFCMRPETGSQVAVGFISGDKNSPIVLGVVRDNSTNPPQDTLDQDNELKAVITKGGHKLLFYETKEPRIEIKTAGGFKITLDDKNNCISIQGKEEKNSFVIDENAGSIEIKADKKISLSVGSSSKIEITDTQLSIGASKISIKGEQQLELDGGAQGQLSGNSLEIKGTGSLKIQSSGVAEVKGSLLKLN